MIGVSEQKRAEQMERRTWRVVWLAFAVWLVAVTLATGWAAAFIQSSVMPAPSTLGAVSGVVLYREADQRSEASAREGLQIFEGDEIATSFGSRAAIRVPDGSAVELFPETRIQLEAARIGRFNSAATQTRLALFTGTVRLSVPELGGRGPGVQLVLPEGMLSFAPGDYTVRASREATRVSVWSGHATFLARDGPKEALDGTKLVIAAGGTTTTIDLLENIVSNGDFSENLAGWEIWEDLEQGRPDVRGQLEVIGASGTASPAKALRIWRSSLRDAHNETGLRQRLDRDVAGARAIRVEARLRVDLASLSGGGYLGSEYPMMLRVRLRDARGGDVVWTQGFYYANPENRPVPIGVTVPRGDWVAVSADLLQAVNQPATIESIEVFGAGHTFDALISSVRLLVD
jgi:hypothetical protein